MQTKIISPRVHGIADWFNAVTMPLWPRIFGWDRRVSRICDGLAVGTAATSLVTDYEAGAVPAISLKTHLKVDVIAGGALMALAGLMPRQPWGARACLAVAGATYLAAGLMTHTRRSPRAKKVAHGVPGSQLRYGKTPMQRYAEQHRPEAVMSGGRFR